MLTLTEIPTHELRDELVRRNALRPRNADARLALALIERAGKSYGLTAAQVMSRRRDTPHCHARWCVCAALANAGWLPSRIAAVFAFDQGTITNAMQRAGKLAASDALFLGTLRILRAELSEGSPAASSPITSNQ